MNYGRSDMARRDLWSHEFRRMVILGESTVEGGAWLPRREDRFADILAGLISSCQEHPLEYFNKGIGANAISPRSPGYGDSAKPSALERYRDDVIALAPDLFVLCYGLNDMRVGMEPENFREDMQQIISDVNAACHPLTVLTTVYHITRYHSRAPFDRGSPELTVRYNDVIRQLAEANGCILADVYDAEGQADWLIHPDGVHPNRPGNLLIAHRIFESIAQSCSCLTIRAFQQDADTEWTRFTTGLREKYGDPFRKSW
jgi:lysophospholipase L1-like esterase